MRINLEEYRIRATRLSKALCADDPAIALRAAHRFRALPAFAGRPAEEIQASRENVRRKHALAVIAKEAGYSGWLELKAAFQRAETQFDPTRIFGPRSSAFLNLWYRSYDEALQGFAAAPGRFLFPYRQQFVVCETGMLEALGVDIADPDWDRIGRDWVKPLDTSAQARLSLRLKKSLG